MNHYSQVLTFEEGNHPVPISVPTHCHPGRLPELFKVPSNNWGFADYVINHIVGCVSTFTPMRQWRDLKTAFLTNVVCNVLFQSGVDTRTVLVALTYIERVSHKTLMEVEPQRWYCEDIFIGALILANKYIDELPQRMANWSKWSSLYSAETLRQIEHKLLLCIDYDLHVSETELLSHYDGIQEKCFTNPGYWHVFLAADVDDPKIIRNKAALSPEQARHCPAPIGTGRPSRESHLESSLLTADQPQPLCSLDPPQPLVHQSGPPEPYLSPPLDVLYPSQQSMHCQVPLPPTYYIPPLILEYALPLPQMTCRAPASPETDHHPIVERHDLHAATPTAGDRAHHRSRVHHEARRSRAYRPYAVDERPRIHCDWRRWRYDEGAYCSARDWDLWYPGRAAGEHWREGTA